MKRRAGAHGRSAEAEHRALLQEALLGEEADFRARAKALRARLHSRAESPDSTALIRADRDSDHAP